MHYRRSQGIFCVLVVACEVMTAEAADIPRFKAGQRLTTGHNGVQVAPSNPVARATVGQKLEYKASPQLTRERDAENERLDGLIEKRRASGESGVAQAGPPSQSPAKRSARSSLAPMPKRSNVRMQSSDDPPVPMRGSSSARGSAHMKPYRD